ncbi:MAG: copper amine oxidase N-terminal domain-containing protein [Peptoniphilus sp.]|nr:copper amine oxidase N-terminal domain-containing protein [Peptoniphilus sp.]
MKKSNLYIILIFALFVMLFKSGTSHATSIEKSVEDLGNNTFEVSINGNIDKSDREVLFLVDYNRSSHGNFTDYKSRIVELADVLFKDESYDTEIILFFYSDRLVPGVWTYNTFTDARALSNRLDGYSVKDRESTVNLQKGIKLSAEILNYIEADKKEIYIFSNQISRSSSYFNNEKTTELKNPTDYVKIGEKYGYEIFNLNNFYPKDFKRSDIDYAIGRNIQHIFDDYKGTLIFGAGRGEYYIEYPQLLGLEEKFAKEEGIEIYPTYSNANPDKLYEYSSFSNTRQIDDLIEFKKRENPYQLTDYFENFELVGDVVLIQSGEQRKLNIQDGTVKTDLKVGDFKVEYRIRPARGSMINAENILPEAILTADEEYKSKTVALRPEYTLTIKNIEVDGDGKAIGEEPLEIEVLDTAISYENLENYMENIGSTAEFEGDKYELFDKDEFLLNIEDKSFTAEIKWQKKKEEPTKPIEIDKLPSIDKWIPFEDPYTYPKDHLYIEEPLTVTTNLKESNKDIKSYEVKIYLDDYKYLLFAGSAVFERRSDVKPVLHNSKTYIPLRFLSEALGYNVSYDDETREASIGKKGFVLKINIDDFTISRNGEVISIEDEIINVDGRLMLPLRSIVAILNLEDYSIKWNEEEKSVTIDVSLR